MVSESVPTKYSLKVVNPQISQYKIVKIGEKLCKDIKDLKELILDNLPETEVLPDDQDMEFGYIAMEKGMAKYG